MARVEPLTRHHATARGRPSQVNAVLCARSEMPMRWSRNRIVLVTAWVISVVVANYVGGVTGFRQGSSTEIALSGHDALQTVTVLRQLRGGNTDGVVTFLETQLDSEISSSVFGEHAYDSPYNVHMRLVFGDLPVETNAWALSEVLQYREEFPSMREDRALSAEIMEALRAYRDAPRPNLSSSADR